MKNEIVALPVFQDRLSPLLDEAHKFIVITLDNGMVIERTVVEMSENSPFIKIEHLKEMGVTVILCGAVSDTLAKFIVERELQLFSWLAGTVDEVIDQYINGMLPQTCFKYSKRDAYMQACRRHRRGWKYHQRRDYNEDSNTGINK